MLDAPRWGFHTGWTTSSVAKTSNQLIFVCIAVPNSYCYFPLPPPRRQGTCKNLVQRKESYSYPNESYIRSGPLAPRRTLTTDEKAYYIRAVSALTSAPVHNAVTRGNIKSKPLIHAVDNSYTLPKQYPRSILFLQTFYWDPFIVFPAVTLIVYGRVWEHTALVDSRACPSW